MNEMITFKDVLQDGHPILREIAKEVDINDPETIKLMMRMMQYTMNSQNDEMARKYNLKPAVGIAAPQIGISKRIFCLLSHDYSGKLYSFVIANPKITKKSKEMIYLGSGEGCLSVDGVTGFVRRYKSIEIEGYTLNFKTMKLEKNKMKLNDYIAVIFQHEYDHLEGILFTDKVENSIDNIQSI